MLVTDQSLLQGITAALRILEPARKKLSTIETQRIIECLDECIRRHELAASTVLILLSDNDLLERYSLALGIELVTAIKSHRYAIKPPCHEGCSFANVMLFFHQDFVPLARSFYF